MNTAQKFNVGDRCYWNNQAVVVTKLWVKRAQVKDRNSEAHSVAITELSLVDEVKRETKSEAIARLEPDTWVENVQTGEKGIFKGAQECGGEPDAWIAPLTPNGIGLVIPSDPRELKPIEQPEWENLLNLTSVPALAQDSPSPEQSSEALNSSALQSVTDGVMKSLTEDIQAFQITEASTASETQLNGSSDTISHAQEESISSPPRPLANHSASKENDSEAMMSVTASPQSSERLTDCDPDSLRSKMFPDSSPAPINLIAEQEHTSGILWAHYPDAGMMQNGKSSAVDTLPPPSLEEGYCWLESPGALSSNGSGRPPGQSRLEAGLRKNGVLLNGEVLNPDFLASSFNLPANYLDPSESRTAMQLLEDSERQQEIFSIPESPRSPSEESVTCPNCQAPLSKLVNGSCCGWFATIPWNEQQDWNEPLDPDDVWRVGDRVQWKKGNLQIGTVRGCEWREILGGKLPLVIVRWDNLESDVAIPPEELWRIWEEEEEDELEQHVTQEEIDEQEGRIIIDPEFKALIPPLSNEERSQLEANLIDYGCRDPLVIWEGHSILLDGHNRHEICSRLGIQFHTVSIALENRGAAYNWLIDNQLGRRNLTPEATSYLRGKHYEREKSAGHGAKSAGQNDTQNLEASERLAEKYRVSPSTIKRDAQYAIAVDQVAAAVGEKVRQEILGRDSRLTKKDTVAIAKVAKSEGETAAKQLLQEKTGQWVPKWGDRVNVIGGYFENHKGQITGTPAPGFVVVALDGNGHERIAIADVELDGVAVQTVVSGASKPFDAHGKPKTREDDHYTPDYVWRLALECFGIGQFDLDPCSNSKTDPNVPATEIYTIEDDGLEQNWNALTLWMNPPYSNTKEWVHKLIQEHQAGNVKEAIALVKGDFSTQWFQPLLDYPVCLVNHRIAFINPKNEGRGAKFSSALVYLGDRIEEFYNTFDVRYSEQGLGIVVQAGVKGVHFGE